MLFEIAFTGSLVRALKVWYTHQNGVNLFDAPEYIAKEIMRESFFSGTDLMSLSNDKLTSHPKRFVHLFHGQTPPMLQWIFMLHWIQ